MSTMSICPPLSALRAGAREASVRRHARRLARSIEHAARSRRRHRHRRAPHRRGARAGEPLRGVPLRPLARRTARSRCWRRRCSVTRRRARSKPIGDGVTSVAPGDKVVLTPDAACNQCYWCVRGEYGCCVNVASIMTGTFIDGRTPLSRARQAGAARASGSAGSPSYVITPETGAIKVARRHAARDRVRHRLRGADRRRCGAQHDARCPKVRPCSWPAAVASASRSCRARASRARRGSSSPIRWSPGAKPRRAFGATDVIDPAEGERRRARACSSPAASVSTTRSTRWARPPRSSRASGRRATAAPR